MALEEIEPPIWRRVRVPDHCTLQQCHRILQLVFGWVDYHPYEFELGDRRFSLPDADPDYEDGSAERLDTGVVRLRDLSLKVGSRLRYLYDFGDAWEHELVVEQVVAGTADPQDSHLALLDGARAGPPEDAGGVSGYECMLEVLRDPDDPEYDEMHTWASMWAGTAYDPERFDPWLVNRTLMLIAAWGAL